MIQRSDAADGPLGNTLRSEGARRGNGRAKFCGRAKLPALGLAAVAVVLAGCDALPVQDDVTGPLPPPPNEAAFQPLASSVQAFQRRGDESAVSRTVFAAAGPDGTSVEISDMIVAPGATANLPPARAARLLDARSGLGSIVISSQTEALSPQRPVSLPAGMGTTVRNNGDAPLVVRIYSVGSR